jgi:hypothetical protein
MTPEDITHLRLLHQQIARPAFTTAGEVVAWLGAVQAQDYAWGLWSVGLRLTDSVAATEAVVEQALAERTIVRTWPMRRTLHIVAAADVRWMLDLLGPIGIARAATRRRQFEVDDATLARAADALTGALEGGRQLARPDALALLEANGIGTGNYRGTHILAHLAMSGLLCLGVQQGRQPAFTLLAEWVPQARRLAREESLAELARRYFTSHGPATPHDFAWWSGLGVTEARRGIALAGKALLAEEAGDVTYWLPAAGAPVMQGDAPRVHLLPGFDEYLLGYTDRSAALDPADAPKVQPGASGVFRPIVVVDGRVRGTWQRTVRAHTLRARAEPFAPLGAEEQAAFAAAAERYGQFVGMAVEVV